MHWMWFGYVCLVAAFLFLLILNFYPLRDRFESAIVQSTRIYDRNGILLYETLHPEQGKTSRIELTNISKYLLQATIATEDASFYTNSGLDFTGIARATLTNLKRGRVVSGASTITQQLVRNVVGVNKERTVREKIKEIFFALRAAKVFTKDEILEMYLNKIYYGNLNYGVAAASEGYFGKAPADLDLAESAFLAGLPQAPNRYDPFEHRDDALARKNYVLTLMRKNNFISDAEFEAAKNEKLVFENSLVTIRAPHFVQYILNQLQEEFGPEYVTAGLKVKTSLDYNVQQKIQDIARRNLAQLSGRNVTNASVVVLDPRNSQIIAMLGSVDYFNEKIEGSVNIALRSRQPGSAMKPITYAVAFEKGWHGATILEDEPVRFFTADGLPYYPKNYDFAYHGTVTIRSAIANSYNIPAIHAIEFAGVNEVLKKARELGLTTLTNSADHYGLALTLGDGEVRLLDLTEVYMALANGGMHTEPISLLEVRDENDAIVVRTRKEPGRRVIDEGIAFMLTDILSDKSARLPEFGYGNVLELTRPAAVKTGTTRNFRDNWTLGYTPDFVVGVWVGNSDNSPMQQISGIYGAGPIWHDVMEEIHHALPVRLFTPPPSVEKQNFCIEEKSDGACGKSMLEWVQKGKKTSRPQSDVSAQTQPIRIVKPFDGDIFKVVTNAPREAQQIKLAAEHSEAAGEITWFIRLEEGADADANWKEVGVGDAVFWQLEKGRFAVEARGSKTSATATIQILVE